jgi:hypothetical protein
VRRLAINSLGYGEDLTYLQPEDVKNYPGFYKVMLVRNPYDRMVSLYKDKVKRKLRNSFRQLGMKSKTSFLEFLEIISAISDEDEKADPHFFAQTAFYYQVMPNLIIRLEGLERWHVLGLPDLKVENASKDYTHYTEFYDEITKKLVEKRYRKDLLILDYAYGS